MSRAILPHKMADEVVGPMPADDEPPAKKKKGEYGKV